MFRKFLFERIESVVNADYKGSVFLLLLILLSSALQSQTPGMIVEPATGVSATILDPNGDGYVSATTVGFLGNDQINNELPWQTLIPAGSEPNSDVQNGPNCGFTDFVESTVGGMDPVFICLMVQIGFSDFEWQV